MNVVSQSASLLRCLKCSSSCSSVDWYLAYREGKIRESGGRRGGDGSRELAEDFMLGGGVGRVPKAPAKKKFVVADWLDEFSFGLDNAVRVSFREGGGGGVGVGGPDPAKGEPKKAAVLLVPLVDTSFGDGRGDGNGPSMTPAVRTVIDFRDELAGLDRVGLEVVATCPTSGMGVGRRVQASIAGSESRRFCMASRGSTATIIYYVRVSTADLAELSRMTEMDLGAAPPLPHRQRMTSAVETKEASVKGHRPRRQRTGQPVCAVGKGEKANHVRPSWW